MLSYNVFRKFARLLLEGQTAATMPERMDLVQLFEHVRPMAFHAYPADPLRTDMAGLQMRLFRLWRNDLSKLTNVKGPPTEDALRAITYHEWMDALHTFYWQQPRMELLGWECVAVCLAECYMRLGSRALHQLQEIVGVPTSPRIDAHMARVFSSRFVTRIQARDLCSRLLDWRTQCLTPPALPIQPTSEALPADAAAESARIGRYLLRLDLSEDEKG